MLLFLLITLLALIGMGCVALAMTRHWRQLPRRWAQRPCPSTGLRLTGAAALGASLLLCLMDDSASIGALVWVMELTLSATVVAAILAVRS